MPIRRIYPFGGSFSIPTVVSYEGTTVYCEAHGLFFFFQIKHVVEEATELTDNESETEFTELWKEFFFFWVITGFIGY